MESSNSSNWSEFNLQHSLKALLTDLISNPASILEEQGQNTLLPSLSTAEVCKYLLDEEDNIAIPDTEQRVRDIPEQYNFITYYTVINNINGSKKPKDESTSQEAFKAHLIEIEDQLFNVNNNKNQATVNFLYPRKPYYKEISRVIYHWHQHQSFPFQFSKMEGLVEICNDIDRVNNLTPQVINLGDNWMSFSPNQLRDQLIFLLKSLGVRGLLTILRLRRTQGSIDRFPPGIKQMFASFNARHSPGVALSVGARAVSKHCLRSQSDKFWGDNKGSDKEKNKKAEEILSGILKSVAWLNIHLLPHDIIIFEVRTKSGYGARWSGDGTEFRGFLEPQMENGHEVGWIH